MPSAGSSVGFSCNKRAASIPFPAGTQRHTYLHLHFADIGEQGARRQQNRSCTEHTQGINV
eukprot:1153171-Pelagomonas_calceolata.AAC.6